MQSVGTSSNHFWNTPSVEGVGTSRTRKTSKTERHKTHKTQLSSLYKHTTYLYFKSLNKLLVLLNTTINFGPSTQREHWYIRAGPTPAKGIIQHQSQQRDEGQNSHNRIQHQSQHRNDGQKFLQSPEPSSAAQRRRKVLTIEAITRAQERDDGEKLPAHN
jgi:uncharacterized FlaG/YvyC family protein